MEWKFSGKRRRKLYKERRKEADFLLKKKVGKEKEKKRRKSGLCASADASHNIAVPLLAKNGWLHGKEVESSSREDMHW